MNRAFEKIKNAEIILEPFPHIIIPDFLEETLARDLLKFMPMPPHFPDQGSYVPGKRYMIYFEESLKNQNLLREFTLENINSELYNLFVEKFDAFLSMKKIPCSITQDEVSFIGNKEREKDKITIDGGYASLAPDDRDVPSPGVHLDSPHKIGNILIYLKPDTDTNPTGAFQMYQMKKGGRIYLKAKNKVSDSEVHNFELVKQIPYTHNTLIAFPNTSVAFHGVEPRNSSSHMRHNIIIGFDSARRVHDHSLYYQGFSKVRHYIQYIVSQIKHL